MALNFLHNRINSFEMQVIVRINSFNISYAGMCASSCFISQCILILQQYIVPDLLVKTYRKCTCGHYNKELGVANVIYFSINNNHLYFTVCLFLRYFVTLI